MQVFMQTNKTKILTVAHELPADHSSPKSIFVLNLSEIEAAEEWIWVKGSISSRHIVTLSIDHHIKLLEISLIEPS